MRLAKGSTSSVTLVNVLSQVLSAVSVFTLPILGANVADVYAVATQVGMFGFSGVAVGIVYNVAVGRVGFRHWDRWGRLAAASVPLAALVVAALLLRSGTPQRVGVVLWALVYCLVILGGSLIAAAGVLGVRLALLQEPLYFAGITVLPNLGVALGVSIGLILRNVNALAFAVTTTALPALLWFIGSMVSFYVVRQRFRLRRDTPARVIAHPGQSKSSMTSHIAVLSAGIVGSSLIPSAALGAVGFIGSGASYALSLVLKIGNTFVSVFVNSMLLVRYNWVSAKQFDSRAPTAIGWVGAGLALFGSILLAESMNLEVLSFGLVVGCCLAAVGWITVLSSGSMFIRELNARGAVPMLALRVVIELAVSLLALVALVQTPSIGKFLAVMLASPCATLVASGICLRRWSVSSSGLCVLVSALVGMFGGGV